MSLLAGARLGGYEVVGPLGAGGMGEVYRARDLRLRREVALKVLAPAAREDPDRLGRFEREAQVLASLNHPNIAQVFGIEDAGGAPVIVMELVEGETLADRLASGAMPVADALAMAAQLCDGLEAAHERGIVHRDLKPANIKVRPDGSIKILDFGLARVLTDEATADDSQSATRLAARTQVGVILGTVAYMSPEQARGRAVDKRTDIWAFGCVLYEMVTGAPVFAGETTTDILSAVVQRDPDWSRLPSTLPARIGELLRRCLEKNARDRLRDIADARFEIERARQTGSHGDSSPGITTARSEPAGRRLVTAAVSFVAGAAIAAGLAAAMWMRTPLPEADPPVRVIVSLPPDTVLSLGRGSAVALSPDGRRLVYAGRSQGVVRLYLRSLDRFEAQPLPGTEGAANPFFSPDGLWVGFFADGKLKKVSLDGGAPVVVTDARNPRGEAWGDENSILLTPTNDSAVFRVSALGGKPEPITALGPGELSHRWPRLLPDGSAVLFTVWNDTGWEPSRIVAQRPGSAERSIVVEAGGGYGRYIPDGPQQGFLVYARSEGLLAVPFDTSRLALTGQAVPVVDGVVTNLSGGAHFDVSRSGTLAYVPGSFGEAERALSWVALDGKATLATTVHAMSRFWKLAPDGTRVVRNNSSGPNRDVWVEDLGRKTSTRVTNVDENYNAIWSSDGKSVIFARGIPISNLFRRAVDGSDAEVRLTSSLRHQSPSSVSPDGAFLAYSEFDPASGSDIWVLPLSPPGTASSPAAEPRPFLKTTDSEGNAAFSPDGRWLAYQSNRSGRFEIYVRPFPGGSPELQVSTAGGIWPVWAPNRQELFYRGIDNAIMAVTVGDAGVSSEPRRLFDASPFETVFDVAPEGTRLLMMPLISAEQSATQVHLVLNFLDELRRRVRGGAQ